MTKKIKITILIPAYNEEANISSMINSILKQDNSNFVLEKVVVVSDKSTDQTNEIVRGYKNKIVHLIINTKRRGKNGIINDFFKKFRGDYIIQLDADCVLKGNEALNKIAIHLSEGHDLVCGYHEPLNPKTFTERMAHFGARTWETAKSISNQNTERYWCVGQIRGFSKKFIKKFRMPEEKFVMEDVFSFYFAKENSLRIAYAKSAVVQYKLPDNIKDYVTQMMRFLKTKGSLDDYFQSELFKKYETITIKDRLVALHIEAPRKPLVALGYFWLQMFTRLSTEFYTQKRIWDSQISTRKVTK